MSKLYIPIAGTWARRASKTTSWYRRGSPFDLYLRELGYTRVEQDRDPTKADLGYWSGNLGGTLFQASRHADWVEGGKNLEEFIVRRWAELQADSAVTDLVFIAHSHGGQVVTYGLMQFPNLRARVVTVDMPVRRDMSWRYEVALENLDGQWTHLHSKRTRKFWKTWPRWLGSRLNTPKLKGAARNIPVDCGHSKVLKEPRNSEYDWRHYLDA